MSLVLSSNPDSIPTPFLIVAEGMGDVRFLNKLLKSAGIKNCCVACPSRDAFRGFLGANAMQRYLSGIQFLRRKEHFSLRGLLMVVDADDAPDKQFSQAIEDLRFPPLPYPSAPFSIEEFNEGTEQQPRLFRTAVFLTPGPGRQGTLEHLLLEATLGSKPEMAACLDRFAECTGVIPGCTNNQQAKMKMSALVASHCKKNPWASSATMWSDNGNPVPITSAVFHPVVEFVRQFTA